MKIPTKEAEENRHKRFSEASKKWADLTKSDIWPAEEHQARFEALLEKALFIPPKKR